MNKDILQIRDVWKKFGGLIAVKNVTFNVGEREILGIIGPNGAGKTTLFNLITGYYKPDRGKIFFIQENITGYPTYKLAKKGLVRTFQIVRPFLGMSILDNVLVSIYASKGLWKSPSEREVLKIAEEVLDFVKLRDKKDILAEDLAHGERKRLEIARALAIDPKLLLLDEPVGGLTPKEIDEIAYLIHKIHREKEITLVIIEHNMRMIMKICDRIIVMNQGEILSEGTAEEVSSDKRVIKAYLGERYVIRS